MKSLIVAGFAVLALATTAAAAQPQPWTGNTDNAREFALLERYEHQLATAQTEVAQQPAGLSVADGALAGVERSHGRP